MQSSEQESLATSSVDAVRDSDREAPLLVGIGEAGATLGISRTTTYKMLREGRFPVPVIRLGGRFRVSKRALERFIESGEEPREIER